MSPCCDVCEAPGAPGPFLQFGRLALCTGCAEVARMWSRPVVAGRIAEAAARGDDDEADMLQTGLTWLESSAGDPEPQELPGR